MGARALAWSSSPPGVTATSRHPSRRWRGRDGSPPRSSGPSSRERPTSRCTAPRTCPPRSRPASRSWRCWRAATPPTRWSPATAPRSTSCLMEPRWAAAASAVLRCSPRSAPVCAPCPFAATSTRGCASSTPARWTACWSRRPAWIASACRAGSPSDSTRVSSCRRRPRGRSRSRRWRAQPQRRSRLPPTTRQPGWRSPVSAPSCSRSAVAVCCPWASGPGSRARQLVISAALAADGSVARVEIGGDPADAADLAERVAGALR